MKCKGCGAPIFWRKTEDGKWTPINPDGTTHWATCQNIKDFKKKGITDAGTDKNTPKNEI